MGTFEIMIDNAKMQIHCNDEPSCTDHTFDPTNIAIVGGGGHGAPHGSSVIVGDAVNGWKDGLDSTYAVITNGGVFSFDMGYGGIPRFDVPDGYSITEARIVCRVSSNPGGCFFQPNVRDNVDNDFSTVNAIFGQGFDDDESYTENDDGVIATRTLAIQDNPDDAYGNKAYSLGQLTTALASDNSVICFISSGGTPNITIYEAKLIITVCPNS